MRIAVTGGYGFIGSSFCELLVDQGIEVFVIDKMTYAADVHNLSESTRKKVKTFMVDIADLESVHKTLDEVGTLDWIVNFAAESHVDRSIENPLVFVDSNVRGVVNLLEYVRKNPELRLLQVSTDEVFGSITEGSWPEDAPLDPRSPYSSSKASAELFCNAYANTYGLSIYITRCANNFGPKQSAEKLIPKVIRSVLRQEQIPIYGDGLNVREWIYVEDHCRALLKLVTREFPNHSYYNIGGVSFSNIEIVREILQTMQANDSLISYVKDRAGHDYRYSVEDSRFVSEFGAIRWQDFTDQLKSTVNWYVANEEWLEASFERSHK